jgi:hypothetical protein
MSFHAAPSCDWPHAFPFRLINLSSEHDAALGQWVVDIALMGFGLSLTWVYDANTELRAELRDMMADETWLDTAHVSMPHADYAAMKADADKWRAQVIPPANGSVGN